MIYENTPQLETERLILRKLTDTPDDMNAMFAILRDQETNTFLPWFPAKDMTDARRHVTGHLKMHHQWAPQNAPPCDMNNLHICRVFSRDQKYFFF